MMPRKRNAEQEAAEGQEQQIGSAATRALDLWIENQQRIFKEFDEVARRWLDRRREAPDATRQTFEEFRNDNSIGGLMRVQQEWAIGSMNRLTAEARSSPSPERGIPGRWSNGTWSSRAGSMSVARSKPGAPAAE
jgi:hypothetical protein